MMWGIGFIIVVSLFASAQSSGFGNCPSGWLIYSSDEITSCLWLSDNDVSSMIDAHRECVEKNSSLMMIDTPGKLKVFEAYSSNKYTWIGLQKSSDGVVSWLTKDGNVLVKNLPFNFDSQDISDQYGVTYYSGQFGVDSRYQRYKRYYICEKRPQCKEGWFGLHCDQECHCHGEKCDPNAIHNAKCLYGCEVGWMGDSCSLKKEDADVRYFCVNSEDQGMYAHILVGTKGVHYDNIHPVDDQGDWLLQCNNTVTYVIGNSRHIKIYVDNSTDSYTKGGICEGQVSKTGSYKWKIKIQEHDGLLSRNDQEVGIECDFTNGDNLILQDNAEVKLESLQMKTGLKRPIKYLEEKKEEVVLELIDPASQKPVTEQIIGSSVTIRIKFGLEQENMATGLRPYSCMVGSPDGKSQIQFLDQNGCSIHGFPISEFHKSGPKTLMTKPFPLFAFDETKEVHFLCEYFLCFDQEPCLKNCSAPNGNLNRYRRSTSDKGFISSTVKIQHG